MVVAGTSAGRAAVPVPRNNDPRFGDKRRLARGRPPRPTMAPGLRKLAARILINRTSTFRRRRTALGRPA